MAFERKYLEDYTDDKKQYSKSIWLTEDNRKDIYELGCRLRQSKLSTIINTSLKIALAKLRVQEDLAEKMYEFGRKNKRVGLDDIDLIKSELQQLLSKSHK